MKNKITAKQLSAIFLSIFILWIEMSHASVVFASQNAASQNEEIYCSQLLDIENENDDSKAMLVFEDNDIIGLLSTSVIEDEVLYSFIYNDFEELNNTNILEKEVAVANIDETIVFITDDNEEIVIYEENNNDEIKEAETLQYDNIETEAIELVPLPQEQVCRIILKKQIIQLKAFIPNLICYIQEIL